MDNWEKFMLQVVDGEDKQVEWGVVKNTVVTYVNRNLNLGEEEISTISSSKLRKVWPFTGPGHNQNSAGETPD